MKNSDTLIHSFQSIDNVEGNFNGLTKREYFAGLAMQGLLSIYDSNQDSIVPNRDTVIYMAGLAVTASDALLLELEKS